MLYQLSYTPVPGNAPLVVWRGKRNQENADFVPTRRPSVARNRTCCKAACMTPPDVPEGFARHFRQSPLTDPWEPLYSKRTDAAVVIGLRAGAAHTNSRRFVHGGLIVALADNAMGLSCALALEGQADVRAGLVTVNLAIDYLGVARAGQWLQIEPEVVKLGSSLCFVQALVTADGEPCARANATFKVLRGP
jgi:uncharacterized protein (TIGR00369 family)